MSTICDRMRMAAVVAESHGATATAAILRDDAARVADVPVLSPEHLRILESFAQDSGAFRLTSKQATNLAEACAAAVKMNAALARIGGDK